MGALSISRQPVPHRIDIFPVLKGQVWLTSRKHSMASPKLSCCRVLHQFPNHLVKSLWLRLLRQDFKVKSMLSRYAKVSLKNEESNRPASAIGLVQKNSESYYTMMKRGSFVMYPGHIVPLIFTAASRCHFVDSVHRMV